MGIQMEPKDWTLLTIAEAGGEQLQPVQLQKALFLIGATLKRADLGTDSFYVFEPYDYGPFCAEIYIDASSLESDGLVEIIRPPASRYNLYSATPPGLATAAHLRGQLSYAAADYLKRVVSWVRRASFSEIVAAVYARYPEMKVNSVFRD
jgi:hypothetical protein